MSTRTTPVLDTVLVTRGRVESGVLTRALVDLAAQGRRPHGSDPGTSALSLSGLEAEQAEAAQLCLSRVTIEPCGQAAEARGEKFEVGPASPQAPAGVRMATDDAGAHR